MRECKALRRLGFAAPPTTRNAGKSGSKTPHPPFRPSPYSLGSGAHIWRWPGFNRACHREQQLATGLTWRIEGERRWVLKLRGGAECGSLRSSLPSVPPAFFISWRSFASCVSCGLPLRFPRYPKVMQMLFASTLQIVTVQQLPAWVKMLFLGL